MCGRFILAASAESLVNEFNIKSVMPDYSPRYNIAPGQDIMTIKKEQGVKSLSFMRWGFIPSWAKDMKIGSRLFNARAETIDQKPAFKNAFAQRRCLIPAGGFYEWKKINGKKQPFRITLPGSPLFAFPGIWETWVAPDGNALSSCSIITTEANSFIRPIHDRMPVIFNSHDEYDSWLSPGSLKDIKGLLKPYQGEMLVYPVSPLLSPASTHQPLL